MKIIRLKNNPNIRDLGGKYDGLTLKEGMLIRGRTLLHLTKEQEKFLVEKCHIRTIIDLRSREEIKEDPEPKIEGTDYRIIPIFEREEQGISHNENEKVDFMTLYRQLPHMDEIYFNMLHGDSLDNFGKVINTIITAKEEEYGFYFHCSEGKDRTGIVAAILLLILGVSKKEIIKDYMLTNKTNNSKAFRYYMYIKYVKFDARFALKVGRTFLAKKKYINVLFNIIKDEFGGSNERFFTEGLHLDFKDIESFKKLMIIE